MIVAVVVVVLGPVFDPVVRLQRSKLLALDLSPGGSVKDPYLGAGGPHAACRGCNTGLRDGSPFCVSGTLGRGALTRSLAPLFLDRHGGAAGRARLSARRGSLGALRRGRGRAQRTGEMRKRVSHTGMRVAKAIRKPHKKALGDEESVGRSAGGRSSGDPAGQAESRSQTNVRWLDDTRARNVKG